MEGCCFHAQRPRRSWQGPSPCRARLRRGQRIPRRLCLLKFYWIQARRGEENVPVERRRRCRRIFFLRGDRLERNEISLAIKFQVDHSRKNVRRIVARDDARIEQLVLIALRQHVLRTLPVPEAKQGRPSGKHGVPVRSRLVVLFHVVLEIVVEVQTERSIGGALRISQPRDHLVRFLGVYFRRQIQPHFPQPAVVNAEECDQTQSQERTREAGDGGSRTQAGGFSRCRYQLRRRRFTRG